MPREFDRTRRVAEQLQRELAELIRREVKDPRVGPVTVSAVRVSRDLAHARVYVGVLDRTERAQETVEALNHAAGHLRRLLGRRLHLRTIPRLRFEYDALLDEASRLSRLLDALGSGGEGEGEEKA
ncbi:30S ribosome-binding factor RbfA [Inmirania thermothiophila]|uniref:Ribosome-binding factor A n=1 Tax=Inmirania thermothiophila TaxID=1750597 RepID=A0A3N1XZR6_9GAMM|nr:30S ribosome-binding factor RbfA [Inmirania thermothiophila]ROR32093.1 ribosome-binding factor A [Inmirania thermothiophila]